MSGGREANPVEWPEPMDGAAHYGIAGEVVRKIDPHTEADRAAVLVQFLIAVGSAIGRAAGFEAESTRHATNLYGLIVGRTSKGRKGSSWQQARRPVELADPGWAERIVSGISSGEGLIHAVRDPVERRRKAKQAERDQADENGYVTDTEDAGEADKRVLAYESEFASVLRVMRRDGSTTGMVIRQAWESGDLRTLTRNSPLRASETHVSVVGHISQEELRRELLTTDAASGFGNRFLFVCARRSKLLPEGGSLTDEDWADTVPDLRSAIRYGGTAEALNRDADARKLWVEEYERLSEGSPGLYGAVTSRAEAQVMRLAVVYAVLDCSAEVRVEHLRAALAVWDYCERSARYIFGERLGDETTDSILAKLRVAGPAGLSRTEIRDLFKRHKAGSEIESALSTLASLGLAMQGTRQTDGRPAETWVALEWAGDESDRSDQSSGFVSISSHRSHRSHPWEDGEDCSSDALSDGPDAGGST
ncbi:MAG TPA: DUF3987 domain-containing protein [Solirubrobacterales bacterium]|nr:DUF3987 domain-containing protein [Solirubrobacterales bacterium]